jgi:hypothetical protein
MREVATSGSAAVCGGVTGWVGLGNFTPIASSDVLVWGLPLLGNWPCERSGATCTSQAITVAIDQ